MARVWLGLGLMLVAPLAAMVSGEGATASVVNATDEGSVTAETTAANLAPVDVVEVSGLIDEINADFIISSLERAEQDGSQAVILQLNTRGSVISRSEMEDLLSAVKNSAVPIAIWVGPSGSRAYGLPAQLLAVADVTAMAPGTRVGRMGLALQVDGERISFGQADNFLRNGSLGFLEAREEGVLKFSTDDRGVPVLRNMLYALDGVAVRGVVLDTVIDTLDDSGQITRQATTVRFFKLGLMPRLMHTVASPASTYLLISAGFALIIFEFFTAGIGVAGLVGAVTLILGSFGLGALPISGLALALLILAFLAFAVDVQVGVPRFWTGLGMALYIVSSFTLFRPTDGMSLRPSWITLGVGIIGIALTYVVGMPSMTRTRFATPTIGRDNLVGSEGRAVGSISPEGTVEISGARWRARTNRATPLDDRQEVRVTGIDGITLEVEPLEGGARDYREGRRKS
jgi:membrane-bound serine protease (ClpP class)